MSNTTIYVQAGGGYDQVSVGESDVLAPQGGEITVRLHA
ncbi:NAD(P)-dependent alcohol dehydrogenase, partial [Pseudomonas syringae pv. actinidiae]|nr:NAD(P)-dependent alcohol dehydrogenase [Pseudomonas syringae pv. actinidiae]